MAPERAADEVRTLAREPRPAGGEAEARARAYCAERLRAAGFEVGEEPFEYSAFVGRWGTSIVGLAALAIVLLAGVAGWRGRAGTSLLMLVLGGLALGALAMVMARSWVLSFPAERRRGINLVATRGSGAPPLWLMAHLDSKSQPVPILVRAAGVTVLATTWIVATALAGLQLMSGGRGAAVWLVVVVCAAAGCIPVVATTVGSASPGALDNASGVAAVLAAVAATTAPVGVCLTSAEELGLAGARAWVRGREPGVAINCDGVDDGGATTCMYSGRRPDRLIADVLVAAARAEVATRVHRLLPGVLTDGVALADAGWVVVTLSKGSARTLARIHTARDRPEALTGRGIADVSRVMVERIGAESR